MYRATLHGTTGIFVLSRLPSLHTWFRATWREPTWFHMDASTRAYTLPAAAAPGGGFANGQLARGMTSLHNCGPCSGARLRRAGGRGSRDEHLGVT